MTSVPILCSQAIWYPATHSYQSVEEKVVAYHEDTWQTAVTHNSLISLPASLLQQIHSTLQLRVLFVFYLSSVYSVNSIV